MKNKILIKKIRQVCLDTYKYNPLFYILMFIICVLIFIIEGCRKGFQAVKEFIALRKVISSYDNKR